MVFGGPVHPLHANPLAHVQQIDDVAEESKEEVKEQVQEQVEEDEEDGEESDDFGEDEHIRDASFHSRVDLHQLPDEQLDFEPSGDDNNLLGELQLQPQEASSLLQQYVPLSEQATPHFPAVQF